MIMFVINIPESFPKYLNYIFYDVNIQSYFYNYHYIDNNIFISSEQKVLIKDFMMKNMRLRNLCRKFIYNVRKSILDNHKSINDIDLLLNNIDELDGSEKVLLYENGRKYTFSQSDVKSIFMNSLHESSDGWPLPKIPKNPYTNLDFSKEQLKRLSHAVDDRPFVMSMFMEYDYNIDRMKSYHINYFKRKAVEDEYRSLNDHDILFTIKMIIEKFMSVRIQIENLNNYKNEFSDIIKDFNLMISCDSKYLKNSLYKDLQTNINNICHKYPIILQKPQRKFLRVKRNKEV